MFLELSTLVEFVSGMDPKLGFIIAAFVFGIASFIFYFVDIVKGPTEPHPVSWLVWFVTQVIATIGMWTGGGGYALAYAVFYCCTIMTIFIYTLAKHGLKNVGREDIVCLSICLVGLIIWLAFDTILIGLVMATAIDAYGFDPSIRKAYKKPWSESLLGWGLMIPNIVFTILAIDQYNFLTLAYPTVMLICTTALVVICWYRRQVIPSALLQGE